MSVNDDGDPQGEWDETASELDDQYKCTDSLTKYYACKTCGKVVVTKEIPPKGEHEYYLYSTKEATCTEGAIQSWRCRNCSAYNSSSTELKIRVSDPLGHDYVELTQLYIPPTEYGSGHEYYVCDRCGKLLDIEIPHYAAGKDTHSFLKDDGSIDTSKGVITKEATCTEDGEMTFTCENPDCGATITFAIPATGHKYPNPATANYETDYTRIDHKDSTCTTAGYDKYAPICTVCHKDAKENGDDTGNNKLTYQVNLPKLGHEWSEWENADDGTYICTAERWQIRHCQNDGCTESEKRLGGETKHTWDDPDNPTKCTVCGYVSNGHHIDYRLNGGTAPAGLADIAGTAYKPGDRITLWQPSSDETLKKSGWTRQTATGQAVFVGWSETDLGYTPLDKKPTTKFISSVTIPEDNNSVVFAVWAVDKNRNGMADYYETPVNIVYDANGGEGDVPESLLGVLPGGAYPLETAPNLKKGDYLFAGWSLEAQSKVIVTHDNTDDIEIIKSLVQSPYTVPEDTTADITLYAVYAVDSDNSGKPDYCEKALHVEYYINGGKVHEGYTVVDDDSRQKGMFYVCNDYHMPGTNATLLAVEHGTMMIYREKAVLIGWSSAPHADLLTSEEEVGDLPITEVSLTGAESNAKVYALWAADVNGNSLADYKEKTLTHTYHRNEYLSDNSGTTLGRGEHLTITKTEPERQINILPGMAVELYDNHYFGSADLVDGEGNVEGHYVQVGWSAYSHGECASWTDYNNWVIGAATNSAAVVDDAGDMGAAVDPNGHIGDDGKYYRIIFDDRFENAYAVWAIDADRNGEPDFGPGPKPDGPGSDPDKPGSDPDKPDDSGDSGSDSSDDSSSDDPTPSSVIDRSEHYGYIIGKTANEVWPEQNITRAEVATILFRLLTDEARQANWSENSGFPDVKSGDWYNHAVAVLHNLGVVEGDEQGRFNPAARITRAEMAAMMDRFYEKAAGLTLKNRFADVDETKWYAQEVLLADHYNLMQGDGDKFRPNDPLNRAEAMAVFNRLLGRKPHKDHLHKDMIVWTDNMNKNKWYYADVQEATNSHECGGNIVVDGKTYETWRSIEPMRDWAALEH